MGSLSLQDQTTLQLKVTLPMDTLVPQGWKEMRKRKRRTILMNPFLMIKLVTEQIYVISLFGNVACINFQGLVYNYV